MTVTNPFEDDSAQYQVLINDEGQHSLWPSFAEVPAGWTVALAHSSRQECLSYVEEHWTDLRPLSLIAATS
jgi:MbtH protein